MVSLRIRFRLWIEADGRYLIGKGGAELLRAIRECGSMAAAARRLGMPYRIAWERLRRMEQALGAPLVETRRGGPRGGESRLTPLGELLLSLYEEIERRVSQAVAAISLDDLERQLNSQARR